MQFTGLTQLKELISLDSHWCPNLVSLNCDEDWQHNVQEDFLLDLFWDLPYLMRKLGDQPANILAAVREPTADDLMLNVGASFKFKGLSVIDPQTWICLLTNLGTATAGAEAGYCRDVFDRTELSEFGLLVNLPRANQIATAFRTLHPECGHCANAQVFAIWRNEPVL